MLPTFESLLGKKVLIEGDVGSGKTTYACRLLRQAAKLAVGKGVAVIDMAPRRRRVGNNQVGGRLRMPSGAPPEMRYYTPEKVFAPRLEGGDAKGVLGLAEANARELERVVRSAKEEGYDTLFVNDLTMFLHAGDPDCLIDAISRAKTFIGTAYKGKFLQDDEGSGVGARETRLLERVEKAVDLTISL